MTPAAEGPGPRWLGLAVRLVDPTEDPVVRRAVAGVLVDEGATAVREEEDALVAHLPRREDGSALVARLRERLEEAAGEAFRSLETWEEEDRDWAEEWRRSLVPRRVGRRLVVAPPEAEVDADPEDLVLRLEPGMAFGSGEHGSTRGVLRLVEGRLREGDRVLDAGTGSGVLAIAAVRLGAGRVVAVDADAEALPVAEANFERNGVSGAVRLVEATVDRAFLALLAPLQFDLVAANLNARALRPLLRPLRERVTSGGALVVGGVLEGEAVGFREAARASGWTVAAEERDAGWWSATLEEG